MKQYIVESEHDGHLGTIKVISDKEIRFWDNSSPEEASSPSSGEEAYKKISDRFRHVRTYCRHYPSID